MKNYKNRKDVPDKYKWDLTEYYKSEDDFNKSYDKALKLIEKIKDYVGCTKDSSRLYEFILFDLEVSDLIENLYVYTYLINDQELGISKSIANKNKCELLMAKYSENTSFFAPELLRLSASKYDSLFKNNSLTEYKPMLDRIYREKKHILSENEEIIINNLINASDHFDDISSTMLNSAHDYGTVILNGDKIALTATNYAKVMKSSDRVFRKETYEKFNKVLDRYGAISASLLDSYVKMRSCELKLRKYASSFDAKLFSLNMSKNVFDALKKNVFNNLDSYQRFLKLFKNVHGYRVLYPYDLNLNLLSSKREYSIEEAQRIILESIKILGDNYCNKFKKIFNNHYIDYLTYKGKCSGGYSFATGSKDSRIMMNYNGDLSSVSTIAHEGGHNVHHQFVKENNPLEYRNPSSIICEVASLTNECLLSNYLAKNGRDKEEKLSGLSNIIEVINSNLFGAVREGAIEEDFYSLIDNGGSITKDYMTKISLDSYQKYYGNLVKMDEYALCSWMRRSHYYMFFYLYSYAICISVATYVASEIINGNTKMLDNYIKFLSAGSNLWPCDVFKILGIDLTKDDVYLGAIKYYNSLIDEFEKIRKED